MGRLILNGKDYSGLIDAQGVFLNTENVIVPTTNIPQGTTTYTATEDCIVTYLLVLDGGGGNVQIDGVFIDGMRVVSHNYNLMFGNTPLKKGQTISFTQTNTDPGNYTVYGIQMGSNVTFLSEYASACYDTNEREIGCWTSGKPLYQKTINANVTIPNNGSVDFALSSYVSDVEDIVYCEVYDSTNKRTVPFYTIQTFSNYGVTVFSDAINKVVVFSRGAGGAITINCYITIRYTKTTDVAGSGKLTPTAMPTVHYDDTEKVIGTWFGETLYEKTIVQTSGITIGSYGTIGLPSNIIVKRLDGCAYRNSHQNVDVFDGYSNNGVLFATIRNGHIEYMIDNIFSGVDEITFTVQYTKSS